MPHNLALILTRRRLIAGLACAGLTGSAAAGGLHLGNIGAGPDYEQDAYRLWQQTAQDGLSDPEYMILCAHLAPSPHNTQPWKFRVGQSHIDILADTDRNIGLADPLFRQMQQGIGCALANLITAAGALGYRAEVALPGAEAAGAEIFVRVSLTALPEGAPLQIDASGLAAIFARSTNRGKYDMTEPVPATLTDRITALGQTGVLRKSDLALRLIDGRGEEAAYVTTALRRAARDLVRDPAVFADSMRWWRPDRAALYASGDGISILTADLAPVVKGGMASVVSDGMWTGEFGRRGEIGAADAVAEATPVWGVIAARRSGVDTRIEAGRLLAEIYLAATEAGYHVHPLNYAVEHPAMSRQMLYRMGLAEPGEFLSVFRLGRGPEMEKAPRRPLADVIAA